MNKDCVLATCKWILSAGDANENNFFLFRYLKILFRMKKSHCHISILLLRISLGMATFFKKKKKCQSICKSIPFFDVLPKENLIMWLHINYNITAVAIRIMVLLMTSGIQQIIFDVAYFKENLKRVKNDCHTWKVRSVKWKVFYLWN